MHHVVIMKKSWNMIPLILSGQKTIESRWYQTRRGPWNAIQKGDTVFFKNSGEQVTAQATVSKVMQYELHSIAAARTVIKEYGSHIYLPETDPAKWGRVPRYCILVFLEKPTALKPFSVSKKGFGGPAAWMTVGDIDKVIQ